MNENEGGSVARSLILTFLAGALVGTAGILMLAPGVRRETSERARGFSRELKRRAAATVDVARGKVSPAISRGQTPSERTD